MNRRALVRLLAGVGATWPLLARAQQAPARMPKVGVLSLSNPEPYWSAFRQGLRELGYVEGRNLQLDLKLADGDEERLKTAAAELVRNRYDVIATIQTAAGVVAKRATREIPIVALAGDPVASGLVTNLARPEGNVTGMSAALPGAALKTVELLKETLPSLRRLAVLLNPHDPFNKLFLEHANAAGHKLALEIRPFLVPAPNALDAIFAVIVKERFGAVLVQPSVPPRSAELALQHRVPLASPNSSYAVPGCLLTYSQDIAEVARQAARYVDRILKGAKPSELPVQEPTKFELIVNQKTARALGITVPQSVLLQANKVIE